MSHVRVARDSAGGRAAFLLVLAAALTIPSLVWPGAASLSSYRSLAIPLVAVGLLVLLIPRRAWSREAVSRFLRTGPNLPILAFVGWMGIEFLRAPMKSIALPQLLLSVGGAAVYFALIYRLPQRRSLQKLVGGLSVAVILSVVVASLTFSQQGGRLAGAFGNPQLLASFMLLMLPLLLVTAQSEDNGARRLAAQFATVFAVAALLFTQNRSTWGGAVVSLVVLGVLALKYATGGRGLAQNRQFILLPAIVVVAAIGLFIAFGGASSQLLARFSTLSAPAGEGSVDWRVDSWKAADRMFLASPLVGQGLGAYAWLGGAVFGAPSLSAVVQQGFPASMLEMPHNLYLLLLSEAGIIGLLLYLGVLVGFLVHCGRSLAQTTSHTRRWLLIGALAAIAGQMVDAFSNPAYQFADINLFFWLVLGIGVAASRPREEREVAVPALAPSRVRFGLPARVAWVAAQAAVLALGGFVVSKAQAGGFIPPNYTRVRGCRVNPQSQTLLMPQPKTPGATRCVNYRLIVSFEIHNPGQPPTQQSFDMTNDANTTWTNNSAGCVFQQAKGVFCWTRPVGNGCTNSNFAAVGTWSTGPGGLFCQGTAALKTGPNPP